MQLSYAIGYPDPLNIWVNTNGTTRKGLTDDQLVDLIREHFKLTPQGHHRDAEPAPADLPGDGPPRPLRPRTAEFTWERTDKADTPRKAAGSKKSKVSVSSARREIHRARGA